MLMMDTEFPDINIKKTLLSQYFQKLQEEFLKKKQIFKIFKIINIYLIFLNNIQNLIHIELTLIMQIGLLSELQNILLRPIIQYIV